MDKEKLDENKENKEKKENKDEKGKKKNKKDKAQEKNKGKELVKEVQNIIGDQMRVRWKNS